MSTIDSKREGGTNQAPEGQAHPNHDGKGLLSGIADFFDLEVDRTLATVTDQPVAGLPEGSAEPVSAAGFRKLFVDVKQQHQVETHADDQVAALKRKDQVGALLETHVDAVLWHQLLGEARAAAAGGAIEFMMLRFPYDLCSDGGRTVNQGESSWPQTLRGEAAELYGRWEQELKPQGFGMTANPVDYPHGMPGDIGLFLTWTEA